MSRRSKLRGAAFIAISLAGCGDEVAPRPDARSEAPSTPDASDAADVGADSVNDVAAGDASRPDSNTDAALLPEPDRSCIVPDARELTLTATPNPATLGTEVRVAAAHSVGLTNITLTLCTPTGPRTAMLSGLNGMAPNFSWWWFVRDLPRGATQAIVRADPTAHVYATARIVVDGMPATLDGGVDAATDAAAPPGVCAPPVGNVLGVGTFEMGMAGLAPTGWEVRNPSQPGACMGSGSPAQHVFLTDPAPGCTGRALAVDSRGQWDCYAVQTVTGYNTIEPGRRYRFSAAARSRGNAPMGPICPECVAAWFTIGAQWLDAGDRYFGDERNPRPTNAADHDHDWRVVYWDVTAPANARRVLVWLTAHYPGRIDFDNVAVTRLD